MRKNKKRIRRNFLIILIIFILICLIYKYKDSLFLNNIFNKETVIANDEDIVSDILSEDTSENSDFNTFNVDTETQLATTNVEIEPHIDKETGEKYLTYEDFDVDGEIVNGIEDDYPRIKETHDVANEYGYSVKATANEYHIFRRNDITPVNIETNTNWNNANIIIHDEDIIGKDSKNYAIFQITSGINNVRITDSTVLANIEINKQTKKIEELAGYGECFCIAFNTEKRQYITEENVENPGATQEDLFRIDNEGNVLNEIQWDFDKITSITLIKIPKETITVGNANFTTILPKSNYEQESGYFSRNIACNRSNTIIENINHNVDNKERIAGPYFGFIKISYVADVILKDSILYSHKYSKKSNYDLTIEHSTNITIDSVISNDIEDEQRWGITGSNYTKDIIYKNCVLNRIDSHRQVYNLTIENCTIGIKGLTLMGSGELNLKNVTRLGYSAFITLRTDYGSTWERNNKYRRLHI